MPRADPTTPRPRASGTADATRCSALAPARTLAALRGTCDEEWIVAGEASDRIQEVHMLILHAIIEGVEREMFPGNYAGG